MKHLSVRLFYIVLIAGLLAAATDWGSQPAAAEQWTAAQKTAEKSSADPAVLCLPGVYLQDPGDCSAAGPSAYLTQMAQKGITFPMAPLPSVKPDPALTYVEYHYGKVNKTNAPVYASAEEALQGDKKNAASRISSPFTYITYTDEVTDGGKRVYMIDSGQWMTASDVTRIGSVPLFQGLAFRRTPDNTFGWVRTFVGEDFLKTKRTPGFKNQDYTGRMLQSYDIVQVYATEQVDGENWYQIGPEEWAHQNAIGRVIVNTTPPEGVTGDRWIEVNLFEQTLSVYDHRQLVFATLVATGVDHFWTRPGLFQIYEKHDATYMRGSFEADGSDAYYLEDVPWTMYFDKARALHGAYWRSNLGFQQSHGCVNLSVGDAHWLFDWANDGDWVYVWDPSGKTPTDPAIYNDGGA
jgi:lipoprotein-anchoring transpeptidase ErfK/SrfK